MKVEMLVIHCTATAMWREVSAKEIREWHTLPIDKGGRGWSQVGYTDIIHLNGQIERLVDNNEDDWVDPHEITNGAIGYNQRARHIVYVGGLDEKGRPKDTRNLAQTIAMKRYILDWWRRFPNTKVVGHNDLAAKDCPCFNVGEWIYHGFR